MTAAPAGGGLAEVLAVLAKATPGKWEVDPTSEDSSSIYAPTLRSGQRQLIASVTTGAYAPANRGAIVAAVNYLRSHGEAIAELIAADKEYDEANLALRSADFTDLAEDESEDDAYDRLCQKFNAADERRAAALAKVASNGGTK